MKLEPLLYVSNLQASVKFYCRVLNFDFGEYYPDESSATYASILIDGQKLRLVQDGQRIPVFHKHGTCGSGVQLFVQVPKVDEVYMRIKGRVEVVDEIENKKENSGDNVRPVIGGGFFKNFTAGFNSNNCIWD